MFHPTKAALAAAALLSTAALAQMPPGPGPGGPGGPGMGGPGGPGGPPPANPLALPGDNPPPSLAAAMAPPRPPMPNAPPPAPRPVVPAVPLDVAIRAIQTAIATCKTNGYTVGAAVSDANGVLIAGLQAPGANPGRIYNATRKNLTAIEFVTPSSAVAARLQAQDQATAARTRPAMTLGAGAVPLMMGGKLVGALGVSGAPGGEKDEVCAVAGVAAVRAQLG